MLTAQKNNLDIVSIIESTGVKLNRSGNRHVGLCPFHAEKTPSFYVFDDNRFKCFGCSVYGDVIDFVQKLYGLSFPDALKHLGIEKDEASLNPEIKLKIEQRQLERQEAKRKKKFRADLQNTLLILISATKKAAKNFKTVDDIEKHGDILQSLPWWEYCLDLISFGTEEEQDFVIEQFKDEEVLPVKGFFKPEFDYTNWLKEFNKQNGESDGRGNKIKISIG